MNEIPILWATELKEAYPARSGVSGWGGMKLLLACRMALIGSTWQEVIDGCKRYKAYCQKTGIEGTVYVKAPKSFIEDQCYLETFTHQEPQDPRISAHKAQEAQRWARASELGAKLSVERYPHDCIEAYETRIRLAQTRGHSSADATNPSAQLPANISRLVDRLKIAK